MRRRHTQGAMISRPVAGAFVAIACAACSSSSTPFGFCTAPASVAVVVDVHDSISGAALADSASGTLATPSFQDSLHHVSGVDSELVGGNQLGTYTVTVHRPSYADWIEAGVVVSRTGPCGNVIPVQLTAALVRAP